MQETLDYSIVEHGSHAYGQACLLRDEMLRKPLGLSLFDEDLDAESDFIHVAGRGDSGTVQAYLQFKPIDERVAKMQQVLVAAHWQGKGVGRRLVEFAEDHARDEGYSEVILHAREVVTGFYEALGYRKEGDVFMEVFLPHFKQRKIL